MLSPFLRREAIEPWWRQALQEETGEGSRARIVIANFPEAFRTAPSASRSKYPTKDITSTARSSRRNCTPRSTRPWTAIGPRKPRGASSPGESRQARVRLRLRVPGRVNASAMVRRPLWSGSSNDQSGAPSPLGIPLRDVAPILDLRLTPCVSSSSAEQSGLVMAVPRHKWTACAVGSSRTGGAFRSAALDRVDATRRNATP